ncbi:metal ABC transporter solute-binding protein, Zn/Mn family [Corynebacterium frankenforstense]
MRGRERRKSVVCVSLCTVALAAAGCAAPAQEKDPGRTKVVATTPVIGDIARNVAGGRAEVTDLIPAGADPHSYEPGLRAVRDVANADLALTNGLLLEQASLARTVESGTRPGVPVIPVAEQAPRYGVEHLPLVENVALDAVWLGLRVAEPGERSAGGGKEADGERASGGEAADPGTVDRGAQVELRATGLRGPGEAAAFVTGTFGTPEVYFNSRDGFRAADGYRDDTATLPVGAHTHVSWAFSAPGAYSLDLEAWLVPRPGAKPRRIGKRTVDIAVGVDPAREFPGRTVLDAGHVDITADPFAATAPATAPAADAETTTPATSATQPAATSAPTGTDGTSASTEPVRLRSGDGAQATWHATDEAVIGVPASTLQQIPPEPTYRFLGTPGDETYLLPQAVLGAHVHGEVDPHLWHDVAAGIAYTQVIRDALCDVDPAGTAGYHERAAAYIARLEELDERVREKLAAIPVQNRHLVTTHDGYGYLARAYGLPVAGFVTPNAGVEPSARDIIALTRTLESLRVPAVFLEPNLAGRANDLTEAADRLGIRVCRLDGDTFTEPVGTYVELIESNANSLAECLS